MAEQIATNITWHEGAVTVEERHKSLGQKGVTIWMTGLPSSGKSTIAVALEQVLLQRSRCAYRLDGDNVRHGLNKNLGFSAEDRSENIRRIGVVAKLFTDAGVITITSFISPYRADRDQVRKLHADADLPFLEVFVDCPLDIAEQRDPKGLYKKAWAGEIKGFTGIDDPYEPPLNPEVICETDQENVAESVAKIVAKAEEMGFLEREAGPDDVYSDAEQAAIEKRLSDLGYID